MNDHELDAALRMLTAVDADPAVADRVLRAIDDDRPGHALPVSWLAAAAVVLAVVAGGTWYAAHPLSLPGIPTTVPLAQTRPLQLPSYRPRGTRHEFAGRRPRHGRARAPRDAPHPSRDGSPVAPTDPRARALRAARDRPDRTQPDRRAATRHSAAIHLAARDRLARALGKECDHHVHPLARSHRLHRRAAFVRRRAGGLTVTGTAGCGPRTRCLEPGDTRTCFGYCRRADASNRTVRGSPGSRRQRGGTGRNTTARANPRASSSRHSAGADTGRAPYSPAGRRATHGRSRPATNGAPGHTVQRHQYPHRCHRDRIARRTGHRPQGADDHAGGRREGIGAIGPAGAVPAAGLGGVQLSVRAAEHGRVGSSSGRWQDQGGVGPRVPGRTLGSGDVARTGAKHRRDDGGHDGRRHQAERHGGSRVRHAPRRRAVCGCDREIAGSRSK